MKNTIKIDSTTYPIKFGYGAIKNLGIYLGTNGYDSTILKVNEVLQKLTAAETQNTGIPFDVTDALGYLLLSGLENANDEADFKHENLCDFVLHNPETLPEVFELFMESMPKAKSQKKSPPKKRTQKSK